MKVNAIKTKQGMQVKLYMSNNDITPKSFPILSGELEYEEGVEQRFRKQKLYNVISSKVNCNFVEKVIEEMVNNYEVYSKLINCKSNADILAAKVEMNFKKELDDEYLSKNYHSLIEIAKSFVFGIHAKCEIVSVKSRLGLESKRDLLVPLVGRFGIGKSTIAKKIFGLGEDFIFPLVDGGRTTINNCFLRGYIEKKELYENRIKFKKPTEFFYKECFRGMTSAFRLYVKMRLDNNKIENKIKIEDVLKSFVKGDKAKLDELFGDINDIDNNVVYSDLLLSFNQLYTTFYADYVEEKYDDEEVIRILREIEVKFKLAENNENIDYLRFKKNTIKFLEEKITDAFNEVKELTKNKTLRLNRNKGDITFSLTDREIDGSNDYYTKFVSNNANMKGSLLRLLVEEVYCEMPIMDEIVDELKYMFNDELPRSITLCDTVGEAHSTSEQLGEKELYASGVIDSIQMLNESDAIILVDKASESMTMDTRVIFNTLVKKGLKSKIILAYSFYDNYYKNEIRTDKEREDSLLLYFKDTITNSIEDRNVADKYYEGLYDKETDTKELIQVVFLKGLVKIEKPLKDKSPKRGRRASETKEDKELTAEEKLAKMNEGPDFDDVKSLSKLLRSALKIDIRNRNNDERCVRTNFSINLDNDKTIESMLAVQRFVENYVKRESNVYLGNIPEHNTSEALCDRLKNGEKEFKGVTRKLTPFKDAIEELDKQFDIFFQNVLEVEITKNTEGENIDEGLTVDYIKDNVKKQFSSNINELFTDLIIVQNNEDWKNYYFDGGPGVKRRRARNIYNLLEETFRTKNSFNTSSVITNELKRAILAVDQLYKASQQ